MKKILSFALALVLCFSTMAFAVVGISAAQTECEKGEHDWSAWTMVKAASDCSTPGQMERTCACGAIEYKGVSGKHSVKHVEAVSATCTEAGNIEYWQCELCGKLWTDAECTLEAKQDSTDIPASNHTVEHVEAVTRTCEAKGNVEYWTCSACNLVWLDAELARTAELSETVIPAAHTIERIEAKDASCTENGTVEHWHCTACDKLWFDEALTQGTDAEKIIASATGHSVEHIDVKSATCVEAGNVEYWRCSICNLVWLDAELTHTAELSETIIPAAHTIERIEAKDATCTENGTIEHYHCNACNKLWLDEALAQETDSEAIIASATHTVEHIEAKNATCVENGNVEYWHCSACNSVWLDTEHTRTTELSETIVPAAHAIEHVEAKDATCTEKGNLEYWNCTVCGKLWSDEARLTEVLLDDVLLTKTHNLEHYNAVPACHNDGTLEYWHCSECDKYFADEKGELTVELSALKDAGDLGKLQHRAEVSATATEDGMLEHWYCEGCDSYFTDAEAQFSTTREGLVIPATGEVEAPETSETPETPVEPGESADTADLAVYYIVAIVGIAAVGSAIVFIKKREN